MYVALVFAAVCLSSVSAQAPKRCDSPTRWQAKMFEIDSRRTFAVSANVTYDAIEERVRIDESILTNKTENRDYYDDLFFFKTREWYHLNLKTRVCEKIIPDDIKFYLVGVPPDARSRGEAVIGTNAALNVGLTVNLWSGKSPRGGRYFGIVTLAGCIPVEEIHSLETGDILRQSFFDVSAGYDPNRFIPPPECQ